MILGWLLPDASYEVLVDDWARTGYRPRHGKLPLAVRGVQSAAAALDRAKDRYLGAADEDSVPAVLLGDPTRARRIDIPGSG
jgi:hypothetical protein